MPFTPFHFGPGAAVHAVAPRHVSFLAFCAANVLIDVETLYFLVTHQYPWHRFFHTFIGASLVAAATVLLFLAARRAAPALKLPNLFAWQELSALSVALGAALGVYSHVVLDSMMHADVRPFAPFSAASPLFHVVPLGFLHGLCVALGVGGLALLGLRSVLRSSRRPVGR